MDEFDVIVIGAGIMGSSAAYNCLKQGSKTLLLDQVFQYLSYNNTQYILQIDLFSIIFSFQYLIQEVVQPAIQE